MNLNPLRGGGHTRLRRTVAASAALLISGGMVAVAASQAYAAAGCRVDYRVTNQWSNGFQAEAAVTNLGDPLSSWTLQWTFSGNQQINQSWSGQYSQSGQQVTITNEAWNGNLGTNATVTPGFLGTYSGTNASPTSFTLNGVQCTGSTSPTSSPTSPTVSPSRVSPTPTRSSASPTPTRPSPTTTVPPGQRADNPYAGARVYVNPDWSAKAAAEPGGSAVSNQPTGVWMDRIAAINGTPGARGLREHLDTALSQGASLIQVVIYNLPGRDCAALASNGELGPTEIDRYRNEYINPIRDIFADPAYASLRIVAIIEIDSLPNLITNVSGRPTETAMCNTMKQNGNYETGIAYALSQFYPLTNVYSYIDAAHHGWIGWDDNFGATATLMASVANRATGGYNSVAGFIVNTANYSALTEPYFNINTTVGGQSVRQSSWVDWNRYVDELAFAQEFRNQLNTAGFGSTTQPIGMLIDTSRNGWGGSARPSGPSSSSDLNTFVNQSRIDRRIHAGNWCNQSGAGLGERPRSAPASGIDAYVWIKPPGESDGSSSEIPNDEGKGFDQMCDPNYGGNPRNGNSATGALPNAPVSGHWFSAQFQELVRNAYPPLS